MACPIAAGAAALILQKNPDWTPAQVKHALEATATEKGVAGQDDLYGWGLMDALGAWENTGLSLLSYEDSAHTIPDDDFSGSSTVYIYSVGLHPSHSYRVAYYDGANDKRATDNVTSSASGNLSSQHTFTPGTEADGTWHVIVSEAIATPPASYNATWAYTIASDNFTFSVFELPTVTTSAADNVTTVSVALRGGLTSLGTASSANASFEWGTTSGNLTLETTPQIVGSTGNFSDNLSSLSYDTTYYFRAKAVGDGTSYGDELNFTTKTLASIEITPEAPVLTSGRTWPFTAMGTAADNSTENLTSSVTWSSDNNSVATIDAAGLATALAAGNTIITAELGAISDNATLSVIASVEVNSGNRTALAYNESRGNIPLAIKGIPDLGPDTGVGEFTFNLSWDKDVIEVDNVTAETITDFTVLAGAPNNTTGTANVTGNTSDSYLVENITVATLSISAVGTPGESTSINVTVTQLIDHNSNPVSAVSINATVEIIDLVAETSIAQAVNATDQHRLWVNVNIDRIKDPSDNSTATIPGGIGSYTATASSNASSSIQFLTVRGVSPFDGPTFNATTGVFSVDADNVTSYIQPSNTPVAQLVPILIGDRFASVNMTVTFNAIGSASPPGTNAPEGHANTIILLRGDADKNGVVSVVDSLAIQQYLVGILTLSNINAINAATPVHEGPSGDQITVIDSLAIEQALVGIISDYYN